MFKLLAKFCLIGGFALSATVLQGEVTPERPQPNILLINADDLGYGDLGCYGANHVRTPHIDRLAREGRRYTDAHTVSATCSPSRYGLLTGQYPFRVNMWTPIFMKSPLAIAEDTTTVADVLHEAGYATACVGKWHLGFGDKAPTDWNAPLRPGPLELGFDHYFGVPVVNSAPPFVYVEDDRVLDHDPDDPLVYGKTAKTQRIADKNGYGKIGGAIAAHALYDDYSVGTTFAAHCVDWIDKQVAAKKPFFLYLAPTHIHHPFTPAKRFQGTSDCRLYGDFIHELDWMVGELMTALERHGIADNTLVIFTSDNGGMLNKEGQNAWRAGHRMNADLLGFKFDVWEGGHRVPFIVRWPGHAEAGSISQALISNSDILATFAALTGRTLQADEGPDSFNMLPEITSQTTEAIRDHMIIAPAKRQQVSLREGDWIYIAGQGNGGWRGGKPGSHIFGGPATQAFTGLVNSDIENGRIRKDAPPAQLYNLREDPRQTTNLWREHPERAARMAARLKELMQAPATAPHTSGKPAAD